MGDNYRGDEPAVDLKLDRLPESNENFEFIAATIPARAVPIYDNDSQAIIGYRETLTTGVYRLYDLDGNDAGMEELPLESPLFDPIDLIFLFGGLAGIFGRGAIRGAARTATAAGARLTMKAVTGAAAKVLRGLFRKIISVRSLKFTATTAGRMATKGRYVPVHILHLAIRHGKRVADPQKVANAFLYTIKMIKNGKTYTLEVLVRETDWTILHFLYK